MRRLLRRLSGLLLALVTCGGCSYGYSANPSYFPWLKSPGDIVRTHAKPPGWGYYADFDPYACRLEVRPKNISQPVNATQVLIATVYDNSGQPRRGRRVEWMLEGKGHIVEVDESGHAPGRGYKVDNRYAVSYTAVHERTFDRGNKDPSDDFVIRPGQSWCVISSPVEGDTEVTVYAPGIHNWDRYKTVVTTHWINAGWVIPIPQTAQSGSPVALTTQIYRLTDRMPLANYRVRYTVLDGPPAVFTTTQKNVAEVISDLLGNATANLMQTQMQAGVNRVGIEIIRPPDPCCPTGPGIIIGRGETTIEWLAPSVTVDKQGPPAVAVGQVFSYTITVTNTGRTGTEPLTIRDAFPDGLTPVSQNPPATREGNNLIWTIAPVGPGSSASVQASFRADRNGSFTNLARVVTANGLLGEASAVTTAAAPGLSLKMSGPPTGVVGVPITYQISVTNTGSGPASNVVVQDEFDEGLTHQSGEKRLLEVGPLTLNAGQTQSFSLVLTPEREGTLVNRARAVADGGLSAAAEHAVRVTQPRLKVNQTGPAAKYVRGRVDWTITIANTGSAPVSNILVRDELPAEVSFLQADRGGVERGGVVEWTLASLQPGERVDLKLQARAERVAARALNVVTATAEPVIRETSQFPLEIRGTPALLLEMTDTTDPIAVGQQTTYEIRVTNTGTLVANGIQITAILPPQLKELRVIGPDGTTAQPQGNRLVFPPFDGLIPGQGVGYTVIVEGVRPGDARFRIEMKSNLGPETVIEEESTTVVPAGP